MPIDLLPLTASAARALRTRGYVAVAQRVPASRWRSFERRCRRRRVICLKTNRTYPPLRRQGVRRRSGRVRNDPAVVLVPSVSSRAARFLARVDKRGFRPFLVKCVCVCVCVCVLLSCVCVCILFVFKKNIQRDCRHYAHRLLTVVSRNDR